MARPRNLEPLPREHPAVDPSDVVTIRYSGHTGPGVAVTCPDCHEKRYLPMSHVRAWLARNPNFTGACKPCWGKRPRYERTYRSPRNPSGRKIATSGYVILGKNAIDDSDLDMFDQMRNGSGSVLEHRWVMAKHLGRPLGSNELVDHMDGDKANNQIDNLRLYVRGRQEPGSAPGHGTYYHEWQLALVRIRELEALVLTAD
jgi:hypothetical protein